jgi:hypothetical protein
VKDNNWSSIDPKISVSSRLPKSPARDYVRPEVNKVAVKIKSEDDFFSPKSSSQDGKAEIFINLNGLKEIKIGSHGVEIVDCGFEMVLPAGHRAAVSSSMPGIFISLVDSPRVKVSIFNSGEECVLQDRQVIGKIWIEQVYFF